MSMDLEDKWGLNEQLLQSYRSAFISSQSFILAVGAIVWGKSLVVLWITAVIGIAMIWAVWVRVVVARHKIVDYYKHGSELKDEDRLKLCTVDEYVHCSIMRRKANDLFKLKTNWRETRVALDAFLPLAFSVVWVALLLTDAQCA